MHRAGSLERGPGSFSERNGVGEHGRGPNWGRDQHEDPHARGPPRFDRDFRERGPPPGRMPYQEGRGGYYDRNAGPPRPVDRYRPEPTYDPVLFPPPPPRNVPTSPPAPVAPPPDKQAAAAKERDLEREAFNAELARVAAELEADKVCNCVFTD